MIEEIKHYLQERRFQRLKTDFSFDSEFIEGVDESESREEIYDILCKYTRRLQNKDMPKERIQKMLDSVSRYMVKTFGRRDRRVECVFDRAMPLFYGIAERPERHDRLEDLERSIGQFSFVAELHGIV